jgi:hypothetical protein
LWHGEPRHRDLTMPVEEASKLALDRANVWLAVPLLRRRGIAYQLGLVTYGLALLVAPGTTTAFELGEAVIQSGLGQTLQVRIPYRLSADERLTPACVSLSNSLSAPDALPTYVGASQITISPTHIQILGSERVGEPLIELNVRVRCGTVPHVVRTYKLFVDPPMPMQTFAAVPRSVVDVATQQTNASESLPATTGGMRSAIRTASPRARGQAGGSLMQGQTYVVIRGDTLSGIAARVAGRPGTVRQTVDAIFAANPQAFPNADMNLIQEGRSITIPMLTGSPNATVTVTSTEAPQDALPQPVLPVDSLVAGADTASAIDATSEALTATPVTAPESTAIEETPAAAAPPLDAAVPTEQPIAVPTPTREEPTLRDPATETQPSSFWVFAALILSVVVVVLAVALTLLVRRQRKPEVAPKVPDAPVKPVRETVDTNGYTVEYHEAPDPTTPAPTLATASARVKTVETAGSLSPRDPTDLRDLALASLAAMPDTVDLDVGTPVEEDPLNAPTARVPDVSAERAERQRSTGTSRVSSPVDDQPTTITIAGPDMHRQDHETEHTLTQQLSQEVRAAVADLEATARAAAGENASPDSPQRAAADVPRPRSASEAVPLPAKPRTKSAAS